MFQVAFKTDVGRRRANNQDTVRVCKGLGLCIVADGMGGHKGGEVASLLTADSVEKVIREGNTFDTVEKWIKHAIDYANRTVYLKALNEPDYKGMGTTCSLVIAQGEQVHIGHVGDSRVYLLKDGTIEQMTIDHTLVEDLIARGEIKRAEAKIHPKRNVITRAVGTDAEVETDYKTFVVNTSEKILICSDGLTGKIDDQEILEIVNTNTIELAVEALVNLANDRGGSDNISIVLMAMSS